MRATDVELQTIWLRNADSKMLFVESAIKRDTLQKSARNQTSTGQKPPNQQQSTRQTHQVSADPEPVSNESDESYEMFNVQETPGKPFLVTVQLNNCAM